MQCTECRKGRLRVFHGLGLDDGTDAKALICELCHAWYHGRGWHDAAGVRQAPGSLEKSEYLTRSLRILFANNEAKEAVAELPTVEDWIAHDAPPER